MIFILVMGAEIQTLVSSNWKKPSPRWPSRKILLPLFINASHVKPITTINEKTVINLSSTRRFKFYSVYIHIHIHTDDTQHCITAPSHPIEALASPPLYPPLQSLQYSGRKNKLSPPTLLFHGPSPFFSPPLGFSPNQQQESRYKEPSERPTPRRKKSKKSRRKLEEKRYNPLNVCR